MALSEESLAGRAKMLLSSRGEDVSGLHLFRLIALIPDALELMAKRVAAGSGYEGLMKDFDATPVAGVVDLTALTGILFEWGRSKVKVASTGEELVAVRSLWLLKDGDWPAGAYYAQDGATLRIRDSAGSLTSYVTALKIRANHIPTIGNVPSQYEGATVAALAELAAGKPMALEMTEVGRA